MPASRQSANKRFCSGSCRTAFHNGCRLLGAELYQSGAVSIEALRLHVSNAAGKAVNGSPGAD
jgi:hypothetical protein